MLRPFIKTLLAVFILAWFLPNISYSDWLALVLFSIVLTLINIIVKPVLKLLTLPINIVTLGLFSVVLNVALLWLALYFVPSFTISPMVLFGVPLGEFFTFLVISVILSLTQSFVSIFL
ncbi:phage holin family protein [Candidatus Woesebacteria bacterium]|nr:phage holin family protein [Candidatus Woesebacteria bacterium]